MLGNKGIELGPSSGYGKEMRRWEAYSSQFGAGEKPYVFREYPKMLYKAARVDGKGIQIVERHVVNDDLEQRNMQSRGFHFAQEEAIAAIEAEHTEFGKLAAEREWEIQHGRLSERAVAEVRAAEAERGASHLPEVPRTPIRKRGRPVGSTKAAPAAVVE